MRSLAFCSPKLKLTLLSLMHFVTDGLCSFLIFTRLYPDNPDKAILVFFLYNILAFVTQSPIGLLIDKYNKPKLFLVISILAMLLGYAFSCAWLLSVIFVGISNSIFHVAGGKYVTDKSGNDISHLGIFVSTGAIGLVLGQRYFSFCFLPYIFFGILFVCVSLFLFSSDSETKEYTDEYSDSKTSTVALFAVIAVVAIRSFVGKVASPDFTPAGHFFLILSISTALGKAAGGICSKYFGIRPTTYFSMAIAAVCMTLGAANPIAFTIGIFAFNFTMPITLYYANVMLKGSEGFAFGTLAAILVPGYFIAIAFTYTVSMRIFTAMLCIASMLTITILSKKIKKNDRSFSFNCNS